MRTITVRRRAFPLLSLAVATALLWFAIPLPAHAHDVLVGSDPAEGETLDAPPARVVLSFSADQMAVGNALEVTDPDGTDHVAGSPVVDGRTVTQDLDGTGSAGEWTATWRSVASDGHPISGTVTFTVTSAVASPGRPTSSVDAENRADGASGDDATPTAPADPAGTAGAGDRPSPLLLAGLALAALAAAATVWALVRRLGPTDDEPEERP